MENEVMNYEETMEPEVEYVDAENEATGIGTGVAMLIGAGLTLVTTAIVKLGKKAWVKYKAKKELDLVDEREFVEPTDEEIAAVTGK